jgi:hypothetical protein
MKRLIVLAALASPLILAGCYEHHYNNGYYPAPPGVANDVSQRGYHDGFDAARHDANDRRSPDMRRHGDFRNPPVPGRFADDYRRAFRSGYESFMRNGRDRDGDRDDRRYRY